VAAKKWMEENFLKAALVSKPDELWINEDGF
jgi:hypothetical protein